MPQNSEKNRGFRVKDDSLPHLGRDEGKREPQSGWLRGNTDRAGMGVWGH